MLGGIAPLPVDPVPGGPCLPPDCRFATYLRAAHVRLLGFDRSIRAESAQSDQLDQGIWRAAPVDTIVQSTGRVRPDVIASTHCDDNHFT